MFEHLKAIARRLLRREPADWPPFLPGEPEAGVREPRRRDPGGRSPAAAVREPDQEVFVAAIGRQGQPRH